jgi:hypothetical protein
MDGSASDLRTGLPWQMVEIHDAVRLTLVVETTPERLLGILDRNEPISRLVRNRWLWLAALDPSAPRIHVLSDSGVDVHEPVSRELPRARSSIAWYGGLREHLDPAVVGLPAARTAVP